MYVEIYKATTDSKHNLPVTPNLRKHQFNVKEPDRAYCSDITHVWISDAWFYLVVLKDLFSRQVVGWSMNNRNTKKLVIDSLCIAV